MEIGGVLEPVLATTTVVDDVGFPDDALHDLGTPTIIEDNCFIGARAVITDGVIIEKGSVIATGTFIDPSTKIYDRATGEIAYARIPAGSVVVPGNLAAADGTHSLYCVVIVKQVDPQTRSKLGINELLRGI